MAKIVYLIASHTNPEQVVRLVKTLRTGSPLAKIVIHHDYSESCLPPMAFEGMANVHIVENDVSVKWGDFSMVMMTLRAIEWVSTQLEFDWLVFISGQDYPIQPLAQIEHFIENTPYDGFIKGVALEEAIPCGPVECSIKGTPGKRCLDCITRYYYQYYDPSYHHLPTTLRKGLKKAKRFLNQILTPIQIRAMPNQIGSRLVVGVRAVFCPFNSDFKCYKGSQWFTLNHRCIQYIRQFVQSQPRLVEYYQRTLIPDESFFQTILFNNPALKIRNDNKRFIRWRNHSLPRPEVLRVQDFEQLVASTQHFARKFDIKVDAAVLDLLDQHIMVRG